MKIFFDSSSFAKRFVDEEGSREVEAICSDSSRLGLSVLCVPEIISALVRKKREGNLTLNQFNKAKASLLSDVRDADLINLTGSVIGTSIYVLENNMVRTLDALHVACAIEWKCELFVSSDKRQLDAAMKVGLKVKGV